MLRHLSICALTALIVLSATPAGAQVSSENLSSLGRLYRTWFVPYAEQEDAPAFAAEISAAVSALGRDGEPIERYKAMIKGLALVYLEGWDEAREVATIMDMRLPAKLYEPGDTIKVKVFPLYDREEELGQHYVVELKLVNPYGTTVAPPSAQHFHELESVEIELEIPATLASGRYLVQYSIKPHDEAAETTLTTHRNVFVIGNLRGRLAILSKKMERLEEASASGSSKRGELALDTIRWHIALYNRALREDVPGAYSDNPIFMTHIRNEMGMAIERIDFAGEQKLAEDLADDLLAGGDPLHRLTGDLRLAYAVPEEPSVRVPFRIYVPYNFNVSATYPLVVALHGAGGDENSFMDRYDGLFKQNLQQRGYIGVAVNGRGGAYRGDSEQDTLDVIDLIQSTYPIDKERTYLMGHSMGGGGTVRIGFDHPELFAALGAIAGYGAASQLEKAKDMPIILFQGDEDALVSVERGRQFFEAAQALGMPEVKYIEMEGVDHYVVGPRSMKDLFDWFDGHTK